MVDISTMKSNQVFCEKIHVQYNKQKLKKNLDKVREEFGNQINEKQTKFKKFNVDIDNLTNIFLVEQ